jgi:hypothetical protein
MSGYAVSYPNHLTSGPEYTTDYHQKPKGVLVREHAFAQLIYMASLRFRIEWWNLLTHSTTYFTSVHLERLRFFIKGLIICSKGIVLLRQENSRGWDVQLTDVSYSEICLGPSAGTLFYLTTGAAHI